MLTERQSPPAAHQGASNVDSLDNFIVCSTADHPALNARVVMGSSSDEKSPRRVYLSLSPAERARRRAESRGRTRTLHLRRVVPVVADLGEVLAW